MQFKDGDAEVSRTLRCGLLDFKSRQKTGEPAAAEAMLGIAGVNALPEEAGILSVVVAPAAADMHASRADGASSSMTIASIRGAARRFADAC